VRQTLRSLVGGAPAKPAAKPEPRQPQPKPREPPPRLPARDAGGGGYLGGVDLPSSESESDEEDGARYRPNYTPEEQPTHLQTSVRRPAAPRRMRGAVIERVDAPSKGPPAALGPALLAQEPIHWPTHVCRWRWAHSARQLRAAVLPPVRPIASSARPWTACSGPGSAAPHDAAACGGASSSGPP